MTDNKQKYFTPKSEESKEIISNLRRSQQQAHAFMREFKMNLGETKPLFEEIVPGITKDALKAYGKDFA